MNNYNSKFINYICILLVAVLLIIIVSIVRGVLNPNINNDSIGGNKDVNIKEKQIIKPYEVPGEEYEVVKNTYNGIEVNSNIDEHIKVYISDTREVVSISIEDYVKGVVASEMPALFEIEALKAQAVAARTYAIANIDEIGGIACSTASKYGADICDTVHCQVFKNKEKSMSKWEDEVSTEYWDKISQAVQSTEGEVITYHNTIIDMPLYFSVSGGATENSEDVFGAERPYLVSVESQGDENAPKFEQTFTFSKWKFIELASLIDEGVNLSYESLGSEVEVISRNNTGSVNEMNIGNTVVKGTEFRNILGLNSTNFNININEENVEITCSGFGHGVGMSQWGANGMAEDNKSYKEILNHYYTDTKIIKIKYK